MLKIVVGVVDKMPADTVVKIDKDKGQCGGSSCEKRPIAVTIQVSPLREPRTDSGAFSNVLTVIVPVRCASAVAAGKDWFESARHVQG